MSKIPDTVNGLPAGVAACCCWVWGAGDSGVCRGGWPPTERYAAYDVGTKPVLEGPGVERTEGVKRGVDELEV